MASIPEADVFIPEACKDCSPEDKKAYSEWIDNILISELNHQCISYVHPHRHFPANGDPKENIYTAVTNCSFTICCLCPAIVTKFYQAVLGSRKDKIIFLDIGEPPERWQDWRDWSTQIINCSDAHQVQVAVRRIRQSLVNTNRLIGPTTGESPGTDTRRYTGTGAGRPELTGQHLPPPPQHRTAEQGPDVVLRKKAVTTLPSGNQAESLDSDTRTGYSITVEYKDELKRERDTVDRRVMSVRSSQSSTRDTPSIRSFASTGGFNPFVVKQTTPSDVTTTRTLTSDYVRTVPVECETTENMRFIKIANLMVLDEIEAANPTGGNSADEFLQSLRENTRLDELRAHYSSMFISKYVIPHACRKKDLAGLTKLYAWSSDNYIKLHTLEKIKELLNHHTSITDKTFGKHLVAVERVLRPKKGDANVKDMTIVMLYLEVYRLAISLLYLAVVSGSVSPDQVTDVLDCRLQARDALESLAGEYQQLYNIDPDHVQAHTYVIGKFFTEKLASAIDGHSPKKKKNNLSTLVGQLDILKGKNLPQPRRQEIERAVGSSITECLSDKFLRHVFFHYLVILVCMQPQLQHLLDQLTKIIVDNDKGKPWSCLSLLYGYCTLCESCANEEVIISITDENSQFRRTILKFRQQKMKMNVVTEIVRSLLYHPSVHISDVASCSLRHDGNGDYLPRTKVCIVEASRSTIRKHGSTLGLTLEPEPVKIGGLWHKDCVLLQGKLNHNQRVYCKFPKLTKVSDVKDMLQKVSDKNDMLVKEIRMLKHLQMNGDSANVIRMVAYGATESTQLPYFIFSCAKPERSVSEYLVRSVQRGDEVPLQERVGLAVDILSAVDFCNKQNVLIRHICAHAFLQTRQHGRVVAKLADLSQAQTRCACETLRFYGSKDKGEEVAVAWTAPESIFKSEYTLESEVFSASQTVHEILSHGVHPYQELGIKSLRKKYQMILKYRIWPERKPGEPESMFAALMEAFLYNPQQRPPIAQLLENFRTFQSELNDTSSELGRKLQRMSALQETSAQQRMSALQRMLTDQPHEPEMCSLLDMKDVMQHKDMWEAVDEMEDLYDLYCIGGDTDMVACSEQELQANDDPVLQPGRRNDFLFKSLMLKDMSEEEKDQLRQLKHPNVATVVRFVMDREQPLSLLLDCMSDMTLLELMSRSENVDARFSYYEQIADGMAYLHERHFIHGCLQAKFIYVTPNGRAIVGQLARATLVHLDVYDDEVSQVMEQPFVEPPINSIRWLPKETNESSFMTQKTDVHSFAVLIWEVENALCQPGDMPQSHLAPYCHVEYAQVVEVQRQRHTLPQSLHCPDWLYELSKALMAHPWCRRPSFPEVLRCLQKRVPYNPNVELEESAQDSKRSNRNKLKRITMMIDKEDESMGFLQRGTVYDQQTRRSVPLADNPGYDTQGMGAIRISSRPHTYYSDEVVGYHTYENPVRNYAQRRQEIGTRGTEWHYDVPRSVPVEDPTYYPQVRFAATYQADEEVYHHFPNERRRSRPQVYDNFMRNIQSIHHQPDSSRQSRGHHHRHRSRLAEDVGYDVPRQQVQSNDNPSYCGQSTFGAETAIYADMRRVETRRTQGYGDFGRMGRSYSDDGYADLPYDNTYVYGGNDVYVDMRHVQIGRTQGHGDVRRNPQNTQPHADNPRRRRFPRTDIDGYEVAMGADYGIYYATAGSSPYEDGYVTLPGEGTDVYGDTGYVQRGSTPENGEFRRNPRNTRRQKDNHRRSHRRRHTEDHHYDERRHLVRRDEPIYYGPSAVGEKTSASEDDYSTLP